MFASILGSLQKIKTVVCQGQHHTLVTEASSQSRIHTFSSLHLPSVPVQVCPSDDSTGHVLGAFPPRTASDQLYLQRPTVQAQPLSEMQDEGLNTGIFVGPRLPLDRFRGFW